MPHTTPERSALRNITAVVEQARMGIVSAADALDQIEKLALHTLELPDVQRLNGTVQQGRRIENLRTALRQITHVESHNRKPAASIACDALEADDAATPAPPIRRGHVVSKGVADAEPSIDLRG